jgi:hypothetical protein
MLVDTATRLVQQAPALDPALLAQFVGELRADGRPLALAIAAVAELVGTRIDPGVALPAIAMACSTLCDPKSGDRELEAARYEIDTLLPIDRADARVDIADSRVDVPVTSLRKR